MSATFSPAAQSDLLEIASFIAQRNQARAQTFVDALERQCDALARAPGIGAPRPELGDGVRMLPYGRYLIFYRDQGSQLRIERILHSARDIDDSHFDIATPPVA